MKSENSIKGKYFGHYKTKNIYKVLEDNILMEHPDSKEWIQGVIYEEAYHIEDGEMISVKDPKKFIKSEERFMESFGEVVIAPYSLEPTTKPMIKNI